MTRRLMIIGLDCAPPKLIFGPEGRRLRSLHRLRQSGQSARLRSTTPPITVPAWISMTSGKDPGQLGLYGFRQRLDDGYALQVSADPCTPAPRIWELASEAGRKVTTLWVPGTSPPKAVHGSMLSCFLGEGSEEARSFPPELATQLEAKWGAIESDVPNFRRRGEEALLRDLYRTSAQHFNIAKALWRRDAPDLLMMVEMGSDRLNHVFWKHLDPEHPQHDPAHPLVRQAHDYYAFLDAQVGALAKLADPNTTVLVVSDHGARSALGGVHINSWLIEQGLLTLKRPIDAGQTPSPDDIDWSQSKAWAAGGYYARVFLNIRGRDRHGCVLPEEAQALRRRIQAELTALRGPSGEPLQNQVHLPEELYARCEGRAPDLIAFFDDLNYRALASLAPPEGIFSSCDAPGMDGCNHDWDGIWILSGAGIQARRDIAQASIYDVGKTALSILDIEAPADWLGEDRSRT